MMNFPGHRFVLGFFAVVLGVWLAVMAVLMRASALPPEASGTMLVVFNPGTSEDTAFAALTQAGARVVRRSSFNFIWVAGGDEPGLVGRLKTAGALGAYRELPISPTIAGCVAVVDAKAQEAFGL
ncbi:MAG: hypothetical protein U1E15_07695 [Hyphomicrobiales bacterium]